MRIGYTVAACVLVASSSVLLGQTPPPPRPPATRVYGGTPLPAGPSRVERLDDKRARIGAVTVNRETREVSVPGVINDVPLFEFLVNTKDGYKSYESAIEAASNAIDFNLGLILIGLDPQRSTVRPRFHFDPVPPMGDHVEISVAWQTDAGERKVPADELMWDDGRKAVLPAGRWVYTGSQFIPGSTAFLADRDGVIVGFAHTPAPLIERADPVPPYGAIKLNPGLGLKPGTAVVLTVKALAPVEKRTQ